MIHWGSKVRAIKGNLCSQWTVKIVQPTKRWWWRGWYSGSTGNLTRVAIWWGFWFLELRLWSSDHRMIILRILISKWGSIYPYPYIYISCGLQIKIYQIRSNFFVFGFVVGCDCVRGSQILQLTWKSLHSVGWGTWVRQRELFDCCGNLKIKS